jgi:hypothetical protein
MTGPKSEPFNENKLHESIRKHIDSRREKRKAESSPVNRLKYQFVNRKPDSDTSRLVSTGRTSNEQSPRPSKRPKDEKDEKRSNLANHSVLLHGKHLVKNERVDSQNTDHQESSFTRTENSQAKNQQEYMLVKNHPSIDNLPILMTGREMTVGSFDLAQSCNIDIVMQSQSHDRKQRRKPNKAVHEEFLKQTTIVLNNKA